MGAEKIRDSFMNPCKHIFACGYLGYVFAHAEPLYLVKISTALTFVEFRVLNALQINKPESYDERSTLHLFLLYQSVTGHAHWF